MSGSPKTETLETRAAVDRVYLPYDDRTQILRQIQGYPGSFTRVPAAGFVQRSLTLSELTGPSGLERRLPLASGDFSCLVPGGPRALGQLITVSGRVTDEDGAPIAGAMIEIWQANASGKYVHQWDRHQAPLDPNFVGQGRFLTDAE